MGLENRTETYVEVSVVDFQTPFDEALEQFKENNPEEVEKGLHSIRLLASKWGYARTPLGMFLLNDHGQIRWVKGSVNTPVFATYERADGSLFFDGEPQWNLTLSEKLISEAFILNQVENLREFIDEQDDYDTLYEIADRILRAASHDDLSLVKAYFQEYREHMEQG